MLTAICIIILVLFALYGSILYMFVIVVPMILHVRIKWLQQLKLKGLKITPKKIIIKTDFH